MKEAWETVKAGIKQQVPAHCFKMWIDPVSFIKGSEKQFTLACPNFFSKKRIIGHYSTIIEKELESHLGHPCKLVIEVSKKKEKNKKTPARQNCADTS